MDTKKRIVIVATAGLLGIAPVMAAPPQGKGGGKGAGGQAKEARGKPDHAGKSNNAGKPDRAAKPNQAGKTHRAGNPDQASKFARRNGAFREEDLSVFRSYFEPHRTQPMYLPPGIAKQVREGKGLPPGWRNKLTPGSLLDDAHWNALIPVPTDLRRRLPAGDDARYYLVEDNLIRIHPTERKILGLIALSELLGR